MKKKELLIFIFLVGVVGFNWPILEIIKSGVSLYLFVFWAILIGSIALFSFFNEKSK